VRIVTDLVSNRDGFGVDYDRFGVWCDRFGVERKCDGFGVDRCYLRRIWGSFRPSATDLGWPPPAIWIRARRTCPPKCDGLGVATPFRKKSTSCLGEGKMTARYSLSANAEIFPSSYAATRRFLAPVPANGAVLLGEQV
jgi:hypothetical protein